MMRYRLLHTLLALMLLVPLSCKQQSEVEEPSLELSATTLTFAKEAGEQSLTIMTNKDTWSAFSPQENTWIALTQEGQTLRIRVRANDQGLLVSFLPSGEYLDHTYSRGTNTTCTCPSKRPRAGSPRCCPHQCWRTTATCLHPAASRRSLPRYSDASRRLPHRGRRATDHLHDQCGVCTDRAPQLPRLAHTQAADTHRLHPHS